MEGFAIRDSRAGDEGAVRSLVGDVLGEYRLTLDANGTDADLANLAAHYRDRGGVFRVIVDRQDTIVGCGGLFHVSDDEAELRKMYLRPEVRGRGLGRALLDDLIAAARRLGFRRLTLETASVLEDAIALYQRYGFVETPRDHLASRCDRAFTLVL